MNWNTRTRRSIVLVALAAMTSGATLIAACSDDDPVKPSSGSDAGSDATTAPDTSTPDPDAGEDKTTGSLELTWTYTGTATGKFVTVAVFPGDAPPIAFKAFPATGFPLTGTLDGIPPGSNYAITSKLTDSEEPRPPLDTEPLSDPEFIESIVVKAGETTKVNVTLKDQAPADGGADGGDGG